MTTKQFQYTPIPPFAGGMPLIDVTFFHADQRIQTSALVDSGAALNLLPYDIGFCGEINI
jgi:hypothetical protein